MKLDFNTKLVIFDLDGTLLDSMQAWHDIDVQFFKNHNMDVPSDYHTMIAHMNLAMIAKYTKETYNFSETEEEIISNWYEMASEIYANEVTLKPGALEFLENLKQNGVKMAVATANDEPIYLPCLKRLNILHYFSYINDINKCGKNKDNPKIFTDINEALNISIENTYVAEDTIKAINTAKDAGYMILAVKEKTVYEDAKKAVADIYIEDFNGLGL